MDLNLKRFRRQLSVSPPLEGRMFDVLMDTTSACQLRCAMCPQSLPHSHQTPDVMDEATMRRIVDEVVPYANSLSLSCMAEPMMNPYFGRFLEMLEGNPVPCSGFVTNGMYFPDPIIERVVRSRITMVGFSLDSPDADEYEAIRIGSKFSRVVANIRRLREKRDQANAIHPVLKINCVLMRRNIRSIPRLVELAAELGVVDIDMRHVLPFEGLDMEKQSLVSEPDLADEFVEKARERARELGVTLHSAPLFKTDDFSASGLHRLKRGVKRRAKGLILKRFALPRCSQPWTHLMIHPNSEVYPCTNWIYDPASGGAQVLYPPLKPVSTSASAYCLGDLRRQSFREIFEGSVWRRVREEMMAERPMQGLCRYCTMRLSTGGQVYDPRNERAEQTRKWE